jgi:hypothetical protein
MKLSSAITLEFQVVNHQISVTGRRSFRMLEAHNRWIVAAASMEIIMSDNNSASAPDKAYDPVTLAKKHRISVEDAKAIVDEYGADRKAADKAARRIAA